MIRKALLPTLFLAFAAALPLAGAAQSLYPGTFAGKLLRRDAVGMSAESFDLRDVRLLPGRFRENLARDSAWICSLAADRLLHSFRTTAGVWAGREGGYMTVRKLGGWESLDCELRGHTTGHLLSACALMYASTGEECFRQKGDSLVHGLREVQRVLGTGYLGAFPEELVERNIRGESVWAPWYTLHKIAAGLLDQYLYADSSEALEILRGMARWADERLRGVDDDTRRRMLRNEFGGMPEAWWNLYAITGDEGALRLARFFFHEDVVGPLREGRAEFGTKHTNTFIPKVLAEARNYELTGDQSARTAAEFFWHAMIGRHTFAPGCLSDKEHFFDPEHLSAHLSGYTGETCCTYNLLKLSRHLFCWTADGAVTDYYERALYNHILGQQDPATGMVCYFLPLASGAHKVYSTPERSFWCCVGSGFESHAKYGEAIYYRAADALYVNLMIPSELRWEEKGLRLRLDTRFPEEEGAVLHFAVDAPVRLSLRLRYPAWSGRPEVRVNGRRCRVAQRPGEYILVDRTWRDGDRVEVRYPMSLRLEYTPDDPQRAALFYGPVLLAGRLGTAGFEGPQPDSNPAKYNDYYTYDYRTPAGLPTTLAAEGGRPRVTRTGPLRFETAGGVELAPLYDIHRERYEVYWNIENL